ncbi:hypothetical protein J3R82DRAFT_2242 [Butyriboletus roseoflavus]|nr:hypothetical protein J3R82DRAFT_2242 [Butyriboletus roseoflavus]
MPQTYPFRGRPKGRHELNGEERKRSCEFAFEIKLTWQRLDVGIVAGCISAEDEVHYGGAVPYYVYPLRMPPRGCRTAAWKMVASQQRQRKWGTTRTCRALSTRCRNVDLWSRCKRDHVAWTCWQSSVGYKVLANALATHVILSSSQSTPDRPQMPSALQKRPPAPANSPQRTSDQSSHASTGASDFRRRSKTYAIDIVQTVRVTSDEPLTRRKIDAVKKSLGKLGLEAGDRGCVSDGDAKPGGGLRVVQTALEVVRGSSAKSSSPPPPRPHSASPGGTAAKQKQDRSSQAVQPPKRILFYHVHDPYYGFTNFSPDPVEYGGKTLPHERAPISVTQEVVGATPVTHKRSHVPHPQFLDHRPELAEHIRTCSPRPRVVFDETHRFNPEVRPDWLRVRVEMMDMVLWHKFTQNEPLKRELLSTGYAELVEDSDKDAFWGVGPDGKGENQLGKALQKLREKLRDDVSTKPSEQRYRS